MLTYFNNPLSLSLSLLSLSLSHTHFFLFLFVSWMMLSHIVACECNNDYNVYFENMLVNKLIMLQHFSFGKAYLVCAHETSTCRLYCLVQPQILVFKMIL